MVPWFPWFLEFVPSYLEMVPGYPGLVPGYLGGDWGPLVPGLGPCCMFNPLVPRCCNWGLWLPKFVPSYLKWSLVT